MNGTFLVGIHFLVLGISLAAPVGPIKLEMIKRGIHKGFWPSWLVGLGGVSADCVFLLCIFLGLAPYLQHSFIQKMMMVIGMIMLLYLGITSISNVFSKRKWNPGDSEHTNKAPYWTGFLIALMNPYNFVFWFGIYGASLQTLPSQYDWIEKLFISSFILIGIILWNVNVAFTVHFFRQLINDFVLKSITFLAGLGLLYFCAKLLFHFVKEG